MKAWRNILSAAAVYIGTVVGAGFASGQELMSFFLVYGSKWRWGLCLAGLLFSLCGAFALDYIRRFHITDYGTFAQSLMGSLIGRFMDGVVGAFLVALYCAMSAGAAELLQTAFGFPLPVGAVAFAAFCGFLFTCGAEAVSVVNSLLTPLLLGGGLVLGTAVCLNLASPVSAFGTRPWWVSALIYVSYNMVTTVSVLLAVSKKLKTRRQAYAAGGLGGLGLLLLGLGLGAALSACGGGAGAFPLLPLFSSSQGLRRLYLSVLAAAILTTAVGNGYGALQFLRRKGCPKSLGVLSLLAVLSVFLPFSQWVGTVYPFFGLLGFFQLCLILTSFRKS